MSRQLSSSKPDMTLATMMKEMWGISWWRMPQIPNPITAVAIQMMAPVESWWLSRRKAMAMPVPARVPMAKGQKVLRMAPRLIPPWARRAKMAKTKTSTRSMTRVLVRIDNGGSLGDYKVVVLILISLALSAGYFGFHSAARGVDEVD